jgi:hypothetical protein
VRKAWYTSSENGDLCPPLAFTASFELGCTANANGGPKCRTDDTGTLATPLGDLVSLVPNPHPYSVHPRVPQATEHS